MRVSLLLPTAVLALAFPGALAAACQSSSGCEFWDNNYHQQVLYEVDAIEIDVLILPPASPFPLRDIALAKLAAESWEAGVDAYGQPWFKDNFNITAYAVGLDEIPEDALKDPEIIIVISEHNPVLLFGIGQQLPVNACAERGGAIGSGPPHSHEGVLLQQVECKSGGFTCVAVNANFLLGGAIHMYNLILHEIGHCLGLGHVGDALDFDAKTVPTYDAMSYSYSPNRANCVSNLNVRALEGIYAPHLGQPSSVWLKPGDDYAMPPSSYAPYQCESPDVGILG